MFFLHNKNYCKPYVDDWFDLHRRQFPNEKVSRDEIERNARSLAVVIAERKAEATAATDAIPCPTCGSVFAWIDGFAIRRCLECCEPPSFAMLEKIVVISSPGFQFDATDLLLKDLINERRRKQFVSRQESQATFAGQNDF